MTAFTTIPIEVSPDAILEEAFERAGLAYPGWEPSEGNLEVVLLRAIAFSAVPDLAALAADSAGDVFHRYGEVVLGVPPISAAAAQTTSTWTLVDTAGYTVPAGTQVEVSLSGDVKVAFATTEAATADPGDDTLVIPVAALVTGTGANGADGSATLVSALAYVDTVVLDAPASGGVDAETDDEYRSRLADEAKLLARVPILPADVETMARRVAGVERALALDGYNPDDDTYGNDRMVSVAAVDDAGAAVATGIKTAIDALLEAAREVNFDFRVIDPTFSVMKFHADVTAVPGYDTATVEDSVEAALAEYVNPATWGLTAASTWRKVDTVRRFDAIAFVDTVPGVDYVTGLTLAKGADALATADVVLAGAAPLPQPGVITCTATAP